MINLTPTIKMQELRKFFTKLNRVFFYNRELLKADFDAAKLPDPTIELPPLNGGITFNTGDPDVTRVRLVSGKMWTSYATPGDADISLHYPTIAFEALRLFFNEVEGLAGVTTGITDGEKFEYMGISTDVKKLTGAMLLTNDEQNAFVALPNVESFASLHLEDGDSGQYINSAVTPLDNGDGAAFIIGYKQTDAPATT